MDMLSREILIKAKILVEGEASGAVTTTAGEREEISREDEVEVAKITEADLTIIEGDSKITRVDSAAIAAVDEVVAAEVALTKDSVEAEEGEEEEGVKTLMTIGKVITVDVVVEVEVDFEVENEAWREDMDKPRGVVTASNQTWIIKHC